MTSFMSYGMFGLSGTMELRLSSWRSGSSVGSTAGAFSRLLLGRYESSSRIFAMQSSSSSQAKCATPERVLCVMAPPSCSGVTSSAVTDLMTAGPVINIWLVFLTMKMKSVMAGL